MSSHTTPKKRRRVKKFRLDETSLVDTPAHRPARIAIMKRAADIVDVKPIQKNRLAMSTYTAGHSHSLVLISAHSEGMAELKAGQTSFAEGHVHDWIMDDAGNILISDAEGHSHGLSALVKADDITNEKLAEGILASLASDDPQASDSADSLGDSGDIPMSKNEPKTPETPEVTPEELAKVEQRAERAEQIVKLSPEQRAHYDGLKTDGQTEFLKSEDKDAIVQNATEADPVEYTSDNGDTFRKSDDSRLVKMARERDVERRELAEERALRKSEDLLKRGSELLKSCNGTPEAKAALLGAIEGIKDEAMRKSALEIVQAKDAGLQKAFDTLGTSDDGSGEGTDAETLIKGIAKGLIDADSTLSPERAFVAALDTPEGRKLHSQLAGR